MKNNDSKYGEEIYESYLRELQYFEKIWIK